METKIILTGKEARMWTIMKALENMEAFDLTYGSVVINFSGGNISFVEVKKTFKTLDLST